MEGEKRNLRDAFQKFKEASKSGYTYETKELAECYLHGRGCERDLVKEAEFGSSKAVLELGIKMEREGKESECIRFLWTASDLWELEAAVHLAQIYQIGKIANRDYKESRRLFSIVEEGIICQQVEGFKWEMNQKQRPFSSKEENLSWRQ